MTEPFSPQPELKESAPPSFTFPDPIAFLTTEPPEIEQYRQQGLAMQLTDNNFTVYIRTRVEHSLLQQKVLKPDEDTSILYRAYYADADTLPKNRAAKEGVARFEREHPAAWQYLSDAALIELSMSEFNKLPKSRRVREEFRDQIEHMREQIKEWEGRNHDPYAYSLMQRRDPVKAFALKTVSDYTGLSIAELTT